VKTKLDNQFRWLPLPVNYVLSKAFLTTRTLRLAQVRRMMAASAAI
jgi:hypothetical protein